MIIGRYCFPLNVVIDNLVFAANIGHSFTKFVGNVLFINVKDL